VSIESQFDRMIELLESINEKLDSPGAAPEAPVEKKRKAKPFTAPKPASKAMVEAVEAAAEAAEEEDAVLEQVGAQEEEEITKELVRLALVKMASVVGQQPARDLLMNVGGAKTLSQLDPSRMAAVYRAAMDEAEA